MKLFVAGKALVVHEGKILILQEATSYAEKDAGAKWDVPGGRLEPGESVRKALEREVKEESGLVVTAGEVLGLEETFPTLGGEPAHIVRGYFVSAADTDSVTVGEDHAAYRWILPEEHVHYDLHEDVHRMFIEYLKRFA